MKRYHFGKNWRTFLERHYSEELLENARSCLLNALLLPNLDGKNFLDIGCGSGLHSLAAYRSGAKNVVSFDYDIDSVETTRLLWRKEGCPTNWKILRGDVLNENFMRRFNDIDIVYAWGVLHHTGNMRKAVENAALPLLNRSSGVYLIALYSYNAYEIVGNPRAKTPED